MIDSPIKTYALCCPICKSQSIRKNLLVEAFHLVSVDPLTGELHQGSMTDRKPTEVPPVYLCVDCGYENVVKTIFVREVTS